MGSDHRDHGKRRQHADDPGRGIFARHRRRAVAHDAGRFRLFAGCQRGTHGAVQFGGLGAELYFGGRPRNLDCIFRAGGFRRGGSLRFDRQFQLFADRRDCRAVAHRGSDRLARLSHGGHVRPDDRQHTHAVRRYVAVRSAAQRRNHGGCAGGQHALLRVLGWLGAGRISGLRRRDAGQRGDLRAHLPQPGAIRDRAGCTCERGLVRSAHPRHVPALVAHA